MEDSGIIVLLVGTDGEHHDGKFYAWNLVDNILNQGV